MASSICRWWIWLKVELFGCKTKISKSHFQMMMRNAAFLMHRNKLDKMFIIQTCMTGFMESIFWILNQDQWDGERFLIKKYSLSFNIFWPKTVNLTAHISTSSLTSPNNSYDRLPIQAEGETRADQWYQPRIKVKHSKLVSSQLKMDSTMNNSLLLGPLPLTC